MKMKLVHLTLILVMSLFSACKKVEDSKSVAEEPVKINLTAKSSEVIEASNQFGLKLYRDIAMDEPGNMMISPLSAGAALTMLMNGTKNDTYSQIREMLGYDADLSTEEINEAYQKLVEQLLAADDRVNLSLANAVFYREGFQVKAPFISGMQNAFDAEVQELDFSQTAAVDAINQWASDNTNEKIPKVIGNINPYLVMFLMNALYFKGDWTTQFSKDATEKRPFILHDGEVIMVDAMYREEVVSMVLYEEEYKVIELPFGRKNFSMVIVVPWDSFDTFLDDLTPEVWKGITDHFDGTVAWGATPLSLPAFSFEFDTELNDYLKALGMSDAFDADLADLSGISDAQLYVDFVKQNTFVEVNEQGAEAAAVTTIGIGIISVPEDFMVDRPFVFAIRERTTNTLLFIGKVMNPAE
jgi:serpin B